MRLWHYKLIPFLDDKHLVSCWRECIAIKRQWEKGTLKHRLVSYVMEHDKGYFYNYVIQLCNELFKRRIKYRAIYKEEIRRFCGGCFINECYPEHNDRYLKQCYYNLQEKADRGIITKEEWQNIDEYYTREVMGYGN